MEPVDAATLHEEEVRRAIIYHCQKMGSASYYIADEIGWYRTHPEGIHVFREEHTGALRAYHDRGGTVGTTPRPA